MRLAIVCRIGGRGLSCTRTRQKSGEYPYGIQVGYQFLQPERANVQFLTSHTHIGIALIGANDHFACRGNGKVAARHCCIRADKVFAQAFARCTCQIRRVVIALLRTQLVME